MSVPYFTRYEEAKSWFSARNDQNWQGPIFANWDPKSQKLFTIAKKSIELDLCITIRCTRMFSMLNLITININGDICQKRPGRGKRSRLMHVWYPNTRKLFTIAKKCIELDLCIRIRCTTLYIVLVSLWSILTKIFAKNMYFTWLFLTIFKQP